MDVHASGIVMRRSWRRVAYFDSTLSADLAETLWQAPHSLLAGAVTLRKVGARSTVRVDRHEQSFVLKHYEEPTFRHAVKQNVSRSRARITWLVAHKMANSGIATPRPVACVENRLGPFRGDSYLMYPYVPGMTLRACLQCEADSPKIGVVREQLLELWDRLKQIRVSLADTNLQNFIVGDSGRLWVIDVDKARFHRMAYVAQFYHERGWNQFSRHAHKTGQLAQRLVAELRERLETPRPYADFR